MQIIDKYKIYTNEYSEPTENNEESATNKTRAQEIEIKNIVQMYGMESLIAKWQASEPFYTDMRDVVTTQNALELRQAANEYFENLPARARKIFGDNPDIFYEKFRNGEFEGFIENGILTEELQDHYGRIIQQQRRNYGKVQENISNTGTNSEVNTTITEINNTNGSDN